MKKALIALMLVIGYCSSVDSSSIKQERYSVTVSNSDADDCIEVDGTDILIEISLYFGFCFYQDAILDLYESPYGVGGTVYILNEYSDPEKYTIDNIYIRHDLNYQMSIWCKECNEITNDAEILVPLQTLP